MSGKQPMADQNDDLEQLLDSALSDFQSLNFTPPAQRSGGREDGDEGKEEVSPSTSFPSGVQGLGMGIGLPDLRNKSKKNPAAVRGLGSGMGLPDMSGKNKKSGGGTGKGKQKVSSKDSHVAEALDKLREQTRDTVRRLDSVTGARPDNLDKDAMMEDWVKQFEELSGSQDMESIVETMMQQLLSKDILHEPMKEIGERYPKWLEERGASLTKEDYDRYSRQHDLIKNLNEVYEKEPNNFTKIVDLMQKMQECGQPPSDIVQELAPDIDLAALGQMSPEMLGSQQNCCIM